MWPFKKKPEIRPCQIWAHHSYVNNPFETKQVKVVEVKRGYVKYRYGSGGWTSETISTFRYLYRHIKEVPDADQS